MKTIITAKDLKDMGACSGGYRKFCRFFPNGARITLKNIKLARVSDLNIDWLTFNALNGIYDPSGIWKNYNNEIDHIWDKYLSGKLTLTQAFKEDDRVTVKYLKNHWCPE